MKFRKPGPEETIHKAIVNYLRFILPHGWIVQHTRNGGMSKGENGRAKGMGAIVGWPDLAIYGQTEEAEPTVYFLEVKTPRGVATSEQRKLHDKLRDIGFPVAVVRSLDDVRAKIAEWGLPSREVRS